jgi:tRNA threonylcarbamoyladenosine biosynthesis protein TsaB
MSASPVILGFEAATGASSVALMHGGEVITRRHDHGRARTDALLSLADELLAEAGVQRSALDAVACGRGPGGFTGVRIGVGVAQGIAMGLGCPVVALSSLQILAETARVAHPDVRAIAALFDARMGEVYAGCYRVTAEGWTRAVGPEWLADPDTWALPSGEWLGVGSGFARFPALARSDGLVGCDAELMPAMHCAMARAAARFTAGEWLRPEALQPVYLRDRVAHRAPVDGDG